MLKIDVVTLVTKLAKLDNDEEYILGFFAKSDREAVRPIVSRVLAEMSK